MSFLRISHSHTGFTLVELIIGMTIFAIGLTGVYALLQGTIGQAKYARHEVVVANLLREQVELIKNIRDTNVRYLVPWNSALIALPIGSESAFFSGAFLIENNFDSTGAMVDPHTGVMTSSPIRMKKLDPIPTDTGSLFVNTQLFLDEAGRYTHEHTATGTFYASYIFLHPLSYNEGGNMHYIQDPTNSETQGFVIDARVIVKEGAGYKEYDARSMITDWMR